MSTASLRLELTADRTEVDLVRGSVVLDGDWGILQGRYGLGGARPNRIIRTGLHRFLNALDALAAWPHAGVEWDRKLLALVEAHLVSANALRTLDKSEMANLSDRLAGSRFHPPQELREFQVRDASRLLALPHGLNFSVPGAGKTRVTLAVYEAEHQAKRVERLLVVAPNAAFESWSTELREVLDLGAESVVLVDGDFPPHAEVCIVNYPRLANRLQKAQAWAGGKPTMVVLDEGHRAKRGTGGLWGRACLNLAPLAARRDVLSGTPAPQGVADLLPLLDFAHLGASSALITDPGASVRVVARQIDGLFVRTNKKELELPEARVEVKRVPMRPLHADIYQALRGTLGTHLQEPQTRGDFTRMGRVVFYLLMAATNPKLLRAGSDRFESIAFRVPPLDVPPGSELSELLNSFSEYGPPAKYEEVLRIAKQNAALGRKTLVWSTFVRNLTSLRELGRALQPAVIHGGTPIAAAANHVSRQDEIDRFRQDPNCWLLLANPATLGEGVSLHRECQDAVYLDRSFNAGQYLQSVDRIHRLGMTKPVRITILSSVGSIDDLVTTRLGAKVATLAELLRDPVLDALSLPDDETWADLLDPADLEALFTHLSGV